MSKQLRYVDDPKQAERAARRLGRALFQNVSGMAMTRCRAVDDDYPNLGLRQRHVQLELTAWQAVELAKVLVVAKRRA